MIVRVGAVSTIVFATVFAIRQPPRPDPYVPGDLVTRLRYPGEVNGFRRGPFVRADLHGVFAEKGGERLWVVGSGGLRLSSRDGGATWKPGTYLLPAAPAAPVQSVAGLDSIPTGAPSLRAGPREGMLLNTLRSVHFADSLHGWAAGDSALLTTRDGGATWRSWGPTGIQRAVVFRSRTHGWAGGDAGLLETTNGGHTWASTYLTEPVVSLRSGPGGTAWLVTRAGRLHRLAEDGWSPHVPRGVPELAEPGSGGRALAVEAVGSTVFLAVAVEAGSSGAGGVYRSDDGGERWTRASGEVPMFVVLRFASPRIGWALDAGGNIYGSDDGGGHWHLQHRASGGGRLLDLAVASERRAYAVGENGTILVATDRGRHWRHLTARGVFTAVHFYNERYGVAVGRGGFTAVTRDGGRRWAPGRSGTTRNLTSVLLVTPRRGWAVGDSSTLLRTRDGGRTWVSATLPTPPAGPGREEGALARENLRAVFFFRARAAASGTGGAPPARPSRGTGGTGIIVGALGTVYRMKSPNRWTVATPVPDSFVVAADFVSDRAGWVAGSRTLWKTTDGAATWTPVTPPLTEPASAIDFVSEQVGWVAAPDRIYRTTTGGASWTGAVVDGNIQDIHFANARTGWVVGRNGRVLASDDGGSSWRPRALHGFEAKEALPDLLGLASSRDTLVWAVGEAGAVVVGLHENDWNVIVAPPLRRPPPWWWMLFLLSLAALSGSFLWHRPRQVLGIKDIFASDRPLREGDADFFDFRRLAKGLSRYLRNRSTDPPLTVAVTGAWGRGKSSLLSLVHDDLRRRGHQTVWFNAWDHQREEHLLASLLSAVQSQGVPGIASPWLAIRFRCRLVWCRLVGDPERRGRRTLRRIAAAAVIVAVTVALTRPGEVSRVVTGFTELMHSLGSADDMDEWLTALRRGVQGGGRLGVGLFLMSFGAFLWTIAKALRPFGVSPAALLAPLARAARLRDLADSTGFRHRFAEDFHEVTAALNPRRIVLFIDDLDRCTPDATRTVLEAINFLGQSGRCVVVLGIDRDKVWDALYRHYLKPAKDAQQLHPAACPDPHQEASFQANSFFDKLINIEIELPPPQPEKLARLITHLNEPEPPSPAVRRAHARQRVHRLGRALVAVAVVIAITRGILEQAYAPAISPAMLAAGGDASAVVAAPAPASFSHPIDTPESLSFVPPRPARLVRNPGPQVFGGWVYVSLILLAGVLLVHILAAPRPVVEDSEKFKKALQAWAPLVAAKLGSPREAKRFVNRLRYYAMLVGNHADPGSLRGRMYARIFSWRYGYLAEYVMKPPRGRDPSDGKRVEDDLLVALACLEHCRPDWLRDDTTRASLLSDFPSFLRGQLTELEAAAVQGLILPRDISKEWKVFESVARIARAGQPGARPGG